MRTFLNGNYITLIHPDGARCDFVYSDPNRAAEAYPSLSRYAEIVELSKLSRSELLNLLRDAEDWKKSIRDFAYVNDELDTGLKLTLMAAHEIIDVKRLAISTYLYEEDGIKIIDEVQQ